MKKIIPSIFLILHVIYASAQDNKVIGLYGECDEGIGGYICQQFQLFDDSTFIFYDLLHLSGWQLTHGNWTFKNDTLTLNSNPADFQTNFYGTSNSDSIDLNFYIDDIPAFYSSVITDSIYSLDSLGYCKMAKHNSDVMKIEILGVPKFEINLKKDSVSNSQGVRIYINSQSIEKYNFKDEKWLLNNSKIYHTKDSLGQFNKEIFWSKTNLNTLKYQQSK